MKNLLLVFTMLTSIAVSAQIIIFHPVKVPADVNEHFLNVELNYSKKTAQAAVDSGELQTWALLQHTNPEPDGFNYMWVNVYKDIESATSGPGWWSNSKEVLGVDSSVLYSGFGELQMGRRFIYKQAIELPATGAASFVILNFTESDKVDTHVKELRKYVLPHFKKEMNDNGMIGFGVATKITPQGKDVATMMTYDFYDTLTNAMIHLSGGGVVSGLPMDKITNISWTMRPLMKIIDSTVPKQ
ncbi:hypothetical protein N9M11_01060 [Flavobacteriaceae bacterium]|uniref:hypothetical protein n=1 Tax=Candidatus Arcticimaribacter forsetii TaxID=2820661 RepID=UPI00207706EE|nr:hypothetical protein [Candidatus Arcticimaribacter forsetii]MDA8698699.1 hypothetical protein [Flavobacteriaceae bacterium]MDB2325968.1 hypothetical protein [Flavobacteriaceae bacterium]MDB2329552.1 hypothetical protein [Flavobacteriaceae bacterium]MDB2346087.1 hypothetical protein [Flavobacteriaceae bacterium]MDB4673998.1 hypothetical protein [Flavobacteriaceae bacterium]